MANEIVRISVRELVEFIMRSGSIDNRFGGFDRAQLGARIHRKLQKEAGPDYEKEVSLQDTTDFHHFTFCVQGRADGIIRDINGVTIDEIKTTARDLEDLDEGKEVHWAQAMCYAFFVAKAEALEFIRVRLTYCHIETMAVLKIDREFSQPELMAFYEKLLEGYVKWAKMQREWINCRNASAQSLSFPFDTYRKGQREMAVAVYRTIQRGGRLFCEAPTGIGKTLSTLFPTIKAMGGGLAEKLFYLTAKTNTRQVAQEAMARMEKGGLRFKTVTLTAKDKICFLEERRCNPEECPYAKGYFDRVNEVVYKMLDQEDAFTQEVVEKWARKEKLCPFELALDLSIWADGIIGDYNYLFDPTVALKRFFDEGGRPYVFLMDEAHNLVDRAREMYSASLNKSAFLALKRSLSPKDKPLYQALTKVNAAFIALRKQCSDGGYLVQKPSLEDFNEVLTLFGYSYESYFKKHPDHPAQEEALALYFEVRSYLGITELYDGGYVTSVTCSKSEVWVRQHCLDPAEKLSSRMALGRASVLFSATMTPVSYYISVLGGHCLPGGDEPVAHYRLPSPFRPENFGILIADGISTRYADRDSSYEPIAAMIDAFTRNHRGNYLIFFPSYAYMDAVVDVFRKRYPQVAIQVSQRGMDEAEREAFLEAFKAEGEETLLGFSVMGGVFGEGIDLKGERLIGTVIVGVGLPQMGRNRDILRNYYDENQGAGFDFAYRYPGINKVFQAMGRVIRDSHDRGMALLIDSRFTEAQYRNLFPQHLGHGIGVRDEADIKKAVLDFWK